MCLAYKELINVPCLTCMAIAYHLRWALDSCKGLSGGGKKVEFESWEVKFLEVGIALT
jgi:hypothetical protein